MGRGVQCLDGGLLAVEEVEACPQGGQGLGDGAPGASEPDDGHVGAVELVAQGPGGAGNGAAGRFTGDFSQTGHGAGSRSWFFTASRRIPGGKALHQWFLGPDGPDHPKMS